MSVTAELHAQGKVRDIYEAGDELVMVASDRISAFDVVLPTPIPDKGRVLTGLSLFWFEQTRDLVANHLITADAREFPAPFNQEPELRGRSMLVRRAEVVPVECVARGYLSGSGWKDYQRTGAVCGVDLPQGLVESERLPEPIFTPTTKTPPEEGHDEPMTYAEVAALVGGEVAELLRSTTLRLYEAATKITFDRGVLLADTKFEFGLGPGGLTLADEALTSDSSRYWRIEDWSPGQRQMAYDKQYVRDWATDLGSWDKTPPGPEIPPDVVAETRRRYIALYERITGTAWS
jgi:phosphoribosylaminoimidazole-succinocarboxamide synthase